MSPSSQDSVALAPDRIPPQAERYSLFREMAALLKLGSPIIITQLAQAAMGFTDTLMAGRYADEDLAAIAVGTSLWMPVMLAITGILMATLPLVSQAFGAGNFARIRLTIQQALWLALLLGGLAAALLWQTLPVFQFMSVEPVVASISSHYLQALAFGMPAAALYQVLRCSTEALQQTRPIMIISLAALACNIPFNYLLIYGKAGLPELGGVGCGWATTLVMWLQLLLLWVYCVYSPHFNKIRFWRHWRLPSTHRQLELLWLGIPIGVSIFIEVSMFALIALFLAPLGTETVAGHQATIAFTTLVFMIPLSLSMALTIRTGFALGMGRPGYARFICKTDLILVTLIAFLTIGIQYSLAYQIAALYTSNPVILDIAVSLLQLACLFQLSDAIQVNAAGALRGYKDTRVPLLLVFIAYWMIALPLGYSLSLTEFWGSPWGATGFWSGLIIGLTIAALLLGLRLIRVSARAIEQQPLQSPQIAS